MYTINIIYPTNYCDGKQIKPSCVKARGRQRQAKLILKTNGLLGQHTQKRRLIL